MDLLLGFVGGLLLRARRGLAAKSADKNRAPAAIAANADSVKIVSRCGIGGGAREVFQIGVGLKNMASVAETRAVPVMTCHGSASHPEHAGSRARTSLASPPVHRARFLPHFR